jgi:hypothetical protein
VQTTATKISAAMETLDEQALQESQQQLALINNILDRPEIKRILDRIQLALPFLSDADCEYLTGTITKFRASSAHAAKCAVESSERDDLLFLIDRTKDLKDAICKLFDDLMFYIQFSRGMVDTSGLDEQQERAELRYKEILHIIANAYREMTNLPIIELPKIPTIAPQGTQKKHKKPYMG